MELDSKNTSTENRKEKPQRGVPIIAQGKSAPSGRRPGFCSRDLTSAECLLGVQNPQIRPKQGELSFGLGNAPAVHEANRSADEERIGFLPRAAA